jgi:hypothetical protein
MEVNLLSCQLIFRNEQFSIVTNENSNKLINLNSNSDAGTRVTNRLIKCNQFDKLQDRSVEKLFMLNTIRIAIT